MHSFSSYSWNTLVWALKGGSTNGTCASVHLMTQYFCCSFVRLCFWWFRGLDTQEVNPSTRNTSMIFFNWNLRLPPFNTELCVSLEQQRERGLLCFLGWLILITKGNRGHGYHVGQGEAYHQLRKSSRTHLVLPSPTTKLNEIACRISEGSDSSGAKVWVTPSLKSQLVMLPKEKETWKRV